MKPLPHRLAEVRKVLDEAKQYAIIYDRDADGACSAALVAKYLQLRGAEAVFIAPEDGSGIEITESLLADANQVPLLITLDVPLDQTTYWSRLKASKVVVIDHHIPRFDLSTKDGRFLHSNPMFESDAYMPTSYLAWRLVEHEPRMQKFSWIGATGTVADYGAESCPDIIEIVAKDYPELVPQRPFTQKRMWDSGLGLFTKLISAARGVEDINGIKKAFDAFFHAQGPADVTQGELMPMFEAYEQEFQRLMDDFEHNARFYSKHNAYVYEVSSEYRMLSTLATMVSERHSDSVVLVYTRGPHHVEMSFRCQTGRVNVAQLVVELTQGIGSGGGHAKAAGGDVPARHYDEFMARVENKFHG